MARDTTRRALFAAAGATTMALPAFATGARSEDARFLAWRREAVWWNARANRRGLSDNELDRCIDQMHHFERLILRTPASGIIPASIKTELLLRQSRDFLETQYVAPLASILATLRRLACPRPSACPWGPFWTTGQIRGGPTSWTPGRPSLSQDGPSRWR
jgi:hypothetical protein